MEGWVKYCEYFHLLDADMQVRRARSPPLAARGSLSHGARSRPPSAFLWFCWPLIHPSATSTESWELGLKDKQGTWVLHKQRTTAAKSRRVSFLLETPAWLVSRWQFHSPAGCCWPEARLHLASRKIFPSMRN